jgi:hypothetical protein
LPPCPERSTPCFPAKSCRKKQGIPIKVPRTGIAIRIFKQVPCGRAQEPVLVSERTIKAGASLLRQPSILQMGGRMEVFTRTLVVPARSPSSGSLALSLRRDALKARPSRYHRHIRGSCGPPRTSRPWPCSARWRASRRRDLAIGRRLGVGLPSMPRSRQPA